MNITGISYYLLGMAMENLRRIGKPMRNYEDLRIIRNYECLRGAMKT
jgi:hypothetical protein